MGVWVNVGNGVVVCATIVGVGVIVVVGIKVQTSVVTTTGGKVCVGVGGSGRS